MAIKNYTTSISAEKTISEISSALVKAGANKIMVDYADGLAVALTFQLVHKGKTVFFQLPCNWEGVYNRLKNDSKVPRSKKTDEQALRTAWRIIKDWIEAQLAIIEAELVDTAEVFLPYALTSTGTTIYQALEQNQLLLEDKSNIKP